LKYPNNLPEENKVWWNRSLFYFHTCQKSKGFSGEFNWIRKELGLIEPPKPKPKDD
tara:strand:- start:366 stop:533 length:168 start_codon:yes stop_codon:yes gene_type:complete